MVRAVEGKNSFSRIRYELRSLHGKFPDVGNGVNGLKSIEKGAIMLSDIDGETNSWEGTACSGSCSRVWCRSCADWASESGLDKPFKGRLEHGSRLGCKEQVHVQGRRVLITEGEFERMCGLHDEGTFMAQCGLWHKMEKKRVVSRKSLILHMRSVE